MNDWWIIIFFKPTFATSIVAHLSLIKMSPASACFVASIFIVQILLTNFQSLTFKVNLNHKMILIKQIRSNPKMHFLMKIIVFSYTSFEKKNHSRLKSNFIYKYAINSMNSVSQVSFAFNDHLFDMFQLIVSG